MKPFVVVTNVGVRVVSVRGRGHLAVDVEPAVSVTVRASRLCGRIAGTPDRTEPLVNICPTV